MSSVVFWRVAHKFAIYAPPSVGTGYGLILGVAANARPTTDPRAWFDNQMVMWRAIVLAPYALYWFIGLILFWLFVVLWTGAKMHAAERADRPQLAGPAALQERKQAISPRAVEQANRLAAQYSIRPARKPEPKRDTPLGDAVIYACFGRWDADRVLETWSSPDISSLEQRLAEFEQAAKDEELIVWGKLNENNIFRRDVWDKIPPTHWARNQINFGSVFVEPVSFTEPRNYRDIGDQYRELMVSKQQVEMLWPLRPSADAAPNNQAKEPFPESYTQAALEMKQPEVSKMSNGKAITEVQIALKIEGRQALQECQIWLGELRCPNKAEMLDALVRIGNGTTYRIAAAGRTASVVLVHRNLADLVSCPPFELLTDRGSYRLEEDTQYHLDLELRSEAKYPTKVTLLIHTGVGHEADAAIVTQTV